MGDCFSHQILLPCRSADSGSLMSAEEGVFLNRSLNCEFFEDSSNRRITELDKLLRRFDTNSTTCQEGGTYAGNMEKCLKLAEKVQATQRMAGLKCSVFC